MPLAVKNLVRTDKCWLAELENGDRCPIEGFFDDLGNPVQPRYARSAAWVMVGPYDGLWDLIKMEDGAPKIDY